MKTLLLRFTDLNVLKNLIRCVCHKTKKEAKECDYYDTDRLCSDPSYDMEDNFAEEMPFTITK